MSATPVHRRRWRPRWLTSRAIALGGVFTVVIFAVVLAIAIVFAGEIPPVQGL